MVKGRNSTTCSREQEPWGPPSMPPVSDRYQVGLSIGCESGDCSLLPEQIGYLAPTGQTTNKIFSSYQSIRKFHPIFGFNMIVGEFHMAPSVQFSRSVVSNSVTPWIAARQASLSITNSRNLLKLMSIKSVMPSSHLILCRPLLLLPTLVIYCVIYLWLNYASDNTNCSRAWIRPLKPTRVNEKKCRLAFKFG